MPGNYLRAVVVPTGVFAATEDFGNDSGLQTRIARAAGELSGLLGATSVAGRPAGRRKVEDEFADPVPFELLLQQVGAA